MRCVKKNEGQSTIEFLITFGFTLLLLFVMVKLSLNVTNGFLVHYATYAASRAFLVVDTFSNTPDGSDAEAEARAKEVFKKIVAGNTVTVTPHKIGDVDGKSVFLGVRAQFVQKLAFSNVVGGKKPVTFLSESYIGRTPTMSECVTRICDAVKLIGVRDECELNVTLEDNGC